MIDIDFQPRLPAFEKHKKTDMVLRIANRDARRLWLDALGLSQTPVGPPDVHAIITKIGFVQLDTIRAVERAHHHILWSRNQNYREPMLDAAMAAERRLFEHFTHDASVLPIETYPYWQRQFRRMQARKNNSAWFDAMPPRTIRSAIKARIAEEGPLSTHAFDSKRKKTEMWQRPPHKLALDYMWYAGELATSHRKNFSKFYDLTERVIPDHVRCIEIPDAEQINWLCRAGLDRLTFATIGEIMRFWEAASLDEVKAWAAEATSKLIDVEVQCADGSAVAALASPDIEQRLQTAPPPTSRLRILNPFDPLVRDRNRLSRLFGFDYRIEIFVPAAKRQWGYYVFPILEADRFVGRIEVKADRKSDAINVLKFWPEPRVKWTGLRWRKLDAELERLRRFIGVGHVVWVDGSRSS